MARNFKELQAKLYAKMTPAQRTAHEANIAHDLQLVNLGRMRSLRELSQTALAANLKTDQGSVSRTENQSDMYLSTLRKYVEGLGGRLELRAVFPEQTMTIEVGE